MTLPSPTRLILGTAGHIDHGKTTLVKALTGTNTDRLAEERSRGMSIELGFARWALSNDIEVDVIDVPGHEKFVGTMTSGASGVEAALQLDSPSAEILKRRMEGQRYLDSKLSEGDVSGGGKGDSELRGPKLASSLVDCRFALAKVCMPLLRELEFHNAGRNFVSKVTNNNKNGGLLVVTTEDGKKRQLLGNDAVHTLSVKSFYVPVQKEINRRMELTGGDDCQDSMLRFSPISMNAELERNVSLLKNLTGLDKVIILYDVGK